MLPPDFIVDIPYSLFATPPKIPKITFPSSVVEIFDRHDRERNLFSLPCFANRSKVIIWDSIGKHYSDRFLPDNGVALTSMSGLDLLELALLLSFQKLNYDYQQDRPILMSKRQNFGIHGEPMPFTDHCIHCRTNCFEKFSGCFITNCSLNNSLKADRKSYKGQIMKSLFQIFESTLRKRCPNLKKIIYVRPLRPTNSEWRHSKKCNDIYDDTLRILSKKPNVVGCPFYAIDNQAHERDGIHMGSRSSEHYYRCIMREILDIVD